MSKVVTILFCLLILSGCSSVSERSVLGVSFDQQTPKTRVIVEQKATPIPEIAPTPQADYVILMENLRFLPNKLEIPKGESVRILVKNRQGEHSLVIPELGINTGKLAEGEEQVIVLEATQSGTFHFYCDVGNHERFGMSGQLQIGTNSQ